MTKPILISVIATILATPAIADVLDPLSAEQRHQNAYAYREQQANSNYASPPALHPTNGDESSVPNFYGQFHKSLPHNSDGMVDPAAYELLRTPYKPGHLKRLNKCLQPALQN